MLNLPVTVHRPQYNLQLSSLNSLYNGLVQRSESYSLQLGILLRHGSGDAWAGKKKILEIYWKKKYWQTYLRHKIIGGKINARVLIQTEITSKQKQYYRIKGDCMYINLIISVTGGNFSVRTICHLRHIKYDLSSFVANIIMRY